MGRTTRHGVPFRWHTLSDAAEQLSVSPAALRRQLERRAIRAKDGGTEAHIDGVRARKFANRWRVSFGESWMGR
jgi:hypothetical protein